MWMDQLPDITIYPTSGPALKPDWHVLQGLDAMVL